jgi:hypothetical protein
MAEPAPTRPAPHAPEVVIAIAAAEPEASADDEDTLAEVRRLLLETLRRDTLLARLFAPARVRGARTHDELISLVWEIERERTHASRKRSQLLALLRARELLGMGNTIVAEDSLPAPPSEF